MASILFICTGNIFRSMVAEYALKARLGSDSGYVIGSAGIEAKPQLVHPVIRARLLEKGIDVSRHVQRKLTRELLEEADLAVAMGLDHQGFVRRHFNRDVPLFNEVCHHKVEPVLDLHEAIPDWQNDHEAARRYALSVIDHIWHSIPALLVRLPFL